MMNTLIRWTAIFCLCLLCLPTLTAQVEATGTQYYDLEQWDKAIESFEHEISTQGPRSDLFYNLGRTYHQVGKLPQAILAYERCLVLEPTHQNARRGLRLAVENTKDRLYEDGGMLRSIGDQIAYAISRRWWQVLSLLLFSGIVACVVIFFRSYERQTKRISFYTSLGLITLCLLSNGMIAHQDYYQGQALDRGILLKEVVSVYPEPAIGGLPVFILHAGTSCHMNGDVEQGAQYITLPDGRSGWVDAEAIEAIALDQ